jgi:hypothetical protein
MSRVISGMIVLLFCLSFVVPSTMAQVETSPQTIKGDLLSIKGDVDVYVIKDISGRLVYFHVAKNTKRERMLVPGERIVADVIGERVVALRPAK